MHLFPPLLPVLIEDRAAFLFDASPKDQSQHSMVPRTEPQPHTHIKEIQSPSLLFLFLSKFSPPPSLEMQSDESLSNLRGQYRKKGIWKASEAAVGLF